MFSNGSCSNNTGPIDHLGPPGCNGVVCSNANYGWDIGGWTGPCGNVCSLEDVEKRENFRKGMKVILESLPVFINRDHKIVCEEILELQEDKKIWGNPNEM